jgi:hypothetical protein
MKEIVANKELIAFCGLYCGACGKYLNEKCPGCRKNEKATWCLQRKCCIGAGYASCADCTKMKIEECSGFTSFIAKFFSLIFRSDRKACISRIKAVGYDACANEMAEKKVMTIKK